MILWRPLRSPAGKVLDAIALMTQGDTGTYKARTRSVWNYVGPRKSGKSDDTR